MDMGKSFKVSLIYLITIPAAMRETALALKYYILEASNPPPHQLVDGDAPS